MVKVSLGQTRAHGCWIELFALQFCLPSKSTLSENSDRLLGRDFTARDPLMHSFRLRGEHIALVFQAPDNAPFGRRCARFCAEESSLIVQPRERFSGGAKHQVLPRSRLLGLLMRSFFRVAALITHFERRRVFRPILAPIVEARRCDVGVTQPLLHLRDVGLVLERVGRRGGA